MYHISQRTHLSNENWGVVVIGKKNWGVGPSLHLMEEKYGTQQKTYQVSNETQRK